MRICDLCHGREFVAAYCVSLWRPADEHPASSEWDLCEECRQHVKATIQAVLNTKRWKAAVPVPADNTELMPAKKTRKPKFEGAT